MTRMFYSLIAGVAVLAIASAANAQPVQLADAQLDSVTAGASAIGLGAGAATGTLFSGVALTINTAVAGPNAAAFGDVTSAAASFIPGPGAAAVSALAIALTSP